MIRTVSAQLQRRGATATSCWRPSLAWGSASARSENDDPRHSSRPAARLSPSAFPVLVAPFPAAPAPAHNHQYRSFSSSNNTNNDGTAADPSSSASVEDTLNKLFDEQQQEQQLAAEAAASSSSGDAAWYQTAETATAAATVDWSPTWYNLSDQAIVAVNTMHDFLGVEYGYAIVATTLVLRLGLFPIMVTAQRTTSRMAHLQPEMNALKTRYEQLGTPTRQEQQNFAKQMKALFAKYEVKPSRAFLAPLIQMPIFIGMFFGLKKMPTIFPETLSDGGMFWFTDLTVPDPLYILPVLSTATFFGLIEIGKEQMMMQQRGPQGALMLNFFRAMALLSLPVCISFEASMLCYWVTNNFLTMSQSLLLKQPPVRKYFGIWDPPKPVPGQDDPMAMASVSSMVKRMQGQPVTEAQRIEKHNAQVEQKRQTIRMQRAARARRAARKGITGTRNI